MPKAIKFLERVGSILLVDYSSVAEEFESICAKVSAESRDVGEAMLRLAMAGAKLWQMSRAICVADRIRLAILMSHHPDKRISLADHAEHFHHLLLYAADGYNNPDMSEEVVSTLILKLVGVIR